MKTTIITLLIIISLVGNTQTTDFMYIPNQKSLIATYNSNFSPVGYYIGGYLKSIFPRPYTYTTPISLINRIGFSLTNQKISIMGGVFIENYVDTIEVEPDVWVKIYPLRIITNTNLGPDFTVGLNYMRGFRVGVGIAIPFGIY